MKTEFKGTYRFDPHVIQNKAPDSQGILYCGFRDQNDKFVPVYIKGTTDIKQHLHQLKQDRRLHQATDFAYWECSSREEVELLETLEVMRLNIGQQAS